MIKKILSSLVIIAVFVCFCSCSRSRTDGNQSIKDNIEVPSDLNNGIEIFDLFSYSGAFTEDGSDEPVENIVVAHVNNTSNKDWQYVELEVLTETRKYDFVLTTLLSGRELNVLEKNKAPFEKKEKIVAVKILNAVEFQQPISQHRDEFEISVADSVMNIKSILSADINGAVFVYYKNIDENGFMNGITYRVRFDGLKAGEIKQMSSEHLLKESSKVVFVTYAD